MPKICDLEGVREYVDHLPVELWRQEPINSWPHGDGLGRLVLRVYTECGNASADVDLLDLVMWLRSGPRELGLDYERDTRPVPAREIGNGN